MNIIKSLPLAKGRLGFGDDVIKPLVDAPGESTSSRFGFLTANDVSSSSSSRQKIFLNEFNGDKSLLGLKLFGLMFSAFGEGRFLVLVDSTVVDILQRL